MSEYSNYIVISDSRFGSLTPNQHSDGHCYFNGVHYIAKGGATPTQSFFNYCLGKIRLLIRNKLIDNKKCIFIKICLGINCLLERFDFNNLELNTIANTTSAIVFEKLLRFKNNLLNNFSTSYVSFITIPSANLDKYNQIKHGMGVATTCCSDHASLNYTHDYRALQRCSSLINAVPVIPLTSKVTKVQLRDLLEDLNQRVKAENYERQPGFASIAFTAAPAPVVLSLQRRRQ